jgi:hypothetical protein
MLLSAEQAKGPVSVTFDSYHRVDEVLKCARSG